MAVEQKSREGTDRASASPDVKERAEVHGDDHGCPHAAQRELHISRGPDRIGRRRAVRSGEHRQGGHALARRAVRCAALAVAATWCSMATAPWDLRIGVGVGASKAVTEGYQISGGINDLEIDASEFFQGSQQRPKLEILKPDNGEVLDTGTVDIQLRVEGYGGQFPSQLHDSRICLGLASGGARVLENCFEQADIMTVFHASNLEPGASYMLRVVLFERSQALAVSVRSFRVGAVSFTGLEGTEGVQAVTIQTALQVAMEQHKSQNVEQAEDIYREVLAQHPAHADALHLMGLVHYQKGDPLTAIGYIEGALQHMNQSDVQVVNYHNSLGECLRAAGRFEEAVVQFEQALKINPEYINAKFNLGLTYQSLNEIDRSIVLYAQVAEATYTLTPAQLYELGFDDAMALESTIRQCDLLQLREELVEAQECWESGLRRWPESTVMQNELGNVHVQLGNHDIALEFYGNARELGMSLADLNIAIVLELSGQTGSSMARYKQVLEQTKSAGMPHRHIMIKMATILPRVLPDLPELTRLRQRFGAQLDHILSTPMEAGDTINAEPIHQGFSTGFHLAFHGENNKALKTKLHRVYAQYCPPLLNGVFVSEDHIIMQSQLALQNPHGTFDDPEVLGAPIAGRLGKNTMDGQAHLESGDLQDAFEEEAEGYEGGGEGDGGSHGEIATSSGSGRGGGGGGGGGGVGGATRSRSAAAREVYGVGGYGQVTSNRPVSGSLVGTLGIGERPIRVGWISRFMYKHAIGYMTQGLVETLPRPKYHVVVFKIHNTPEVEDEVSKHIDYHADEVVVLPSSLNLCADMVRAHRLDVLVYPEVGLDPVAYFLTYARLAPVQMAWWGHPDTTGVPTIDYFVSTKFEVADAETHYSERLVRLEGLGAYLYRPLPGGEKNPAKWRDQIRTDLALPTNFHLYLCPQALFKFHPSFDDVLVDILAKDKLAYFLLLDGRDRHAWSKLLLERMKEKMETNGHRNIDLSLSRVLFYKPEFEDDMSSLYQACDVVLDTFPAGGYMTSLQALAVGAPVVTLPGQLLSTRLTYTMYKIMEIDDLIAKDPSDYATLALKVAHNTGYRKRLSSLILARSGRLFTDTTAVGEWDNLLTTAVAAAQAQSSRGVEAISAGVSEAAERLAEIEAKRDFAQHDGSKIYVDGRQMGRKRDS